MTQNDLIIRAYVPQQYYDLIRKNCAWNDSINEYQLNCYAFTGNQMQRNNERQTAAVSGASRRRSGQSTKKSSQRPPIDLRFKLLSYSMVGLGNRSTSAGTVQQQPPQPKSGGVGAYQAAPAISVGTFGNVDDEQEAKRLVRERQQQKNTSARPQLARSARPRSARPHSGVVE